VRRLGKRERSKRGTQEREKKEPGTHMEVACNLFTHNANPRLFDAGQKEALLLLSLYFSFSSLFFLEGCVHVCVLSLSLSL
jgi:hypothetical protein